MRAESGDTSLRKRFKSCRPNLKLRLALGWGPRPLASSRHGRPKRLEKAGRNLHLWRARFGARLDRREELRERHSPFGLQQLCNSRVLERPLSRAGRGVFGEA
jgi:hypothetical protein